MNHPKTLLLALLFLAAGAVMWCGYHDTSHNSMRWVNYYPILPKSIFYNADSLYYYIDRAYHVEDDVVAYTVAGTAAYNLRYFDRAASDSLPAVPIEDADNMLWRAADLQFPPAGLMIHFLDQLNLWHHSIPECDFSSVPVDTSDPDYQTMEIKK